MGMQTMSVQPSTQPSGKGSGFSSPQPQNADITTAVPSAFSGQPRFGQPNQYAQTMGWDKAQFGGASAGNAFFPQGKGQSSGKGQANQPFIAPTQFPVANQFNTQPAPVQEEQKPQAPAYGGSEGYNAGGAD